MNALNEFKRSLNREDIVNWIRSGLIGYVEIQGPFGPKEIIYADYVASGRALSQVEDFIRDKVLPFIPIVIQSFFLWLIHEIMQNGVCYF